MIRGWLEAIVNRNPLIADMIKRFLGAPAVVNSALYASYVFSRARKMNTMYHNRIPGVMIETILNCNAKCIMCYHGSQTMNGIMPMALFRKIIDECVQQGITTVGLSVYGEPLLDPQFIERVGYLRTCGLQYSFFTNASLLTEPVVIKLFDLGGLVEVNFSINGLSRAVYEKVMVGLERDTTYANVHRFLQEKRTRGGLRPTVSISCVKTKYSVDELPAFVRYWRRFKEVDRIITADLLDRIGDAREEDIGTFGPLSHRQGSSLPCREVWSRFLVYYDGRVAPCCIDNDMRKLVIGDVTVQSLREIAASTAVRHLRQIHSDGCRNKHPICGNCPFQSVWL
jgi:MoaA/NifB/PqqE/SkfB family radical SAM enzyme